MDDIFSQFGDIFGGAFGGGFSGFSSGQRRAKGAIFVFELSLVSQKFFQALRKKLK